MSNYIKRPLKTSKCIIYLLILSESPEKFLHTLKEPKKVEKIGNPEDYGIVEDNKPIKSKMSYSANKQRTLDSIMKLDKVEDLDADAINAIWITFLSELRKFPGMITVLLN